MGDLSVKCVSMADKRSAGDESKVGFLVSARSRERLSVISMCMEAQPLV